MSNTITTLVFKKRVQKFRSTVMFTQNNVLAIIYMIDKLPKGEVSAELEDVIHSNKVELQKWADQFDSLLSEIDEIEAKCLETEEEGRVALLAPVPSAQGYNIPEPYKMNELLCRIGFVKINGDPYSAEGRVFTAQQILNIIEELDVNRVFCLKNIANCNYDGVWEELGRKVLELHDRYVGTGPILTALGYDPGCEDE